jgi:DNA repair exonuclease SbcCD ATPase subunit
MAKSNSENDSLNGSTSLNQGQHSEDATQGNSSAAQSSGSVGPSILISETEKSNESLHPEVGAAGQSNGNESGSCDDSGDSDDQETEAADQGEHARGSVSFEDGSSNGDDDAEEDEGDVEGGRFQAPEVNSGGEYRLDGNGGATASSTSMTTSGSLEHTSSRNESLPSVTPESPKKPETPTKVLTDAVKVHRRASLSKIDAIYGVTSIGSSGRSGGNSSDPRTPTTPTTPGANGKERTLVGLQKELKKAWKLLEEANERDNQNKETLTELQNKLKKVQNNANNRHPASVDNGGVYEIVQQRDDLVKQVELKNHELNSLRREIDQFNDRENDQLKERVELLGEIASLKELVSAKQDESEKEAMVRDKLERDIRDLKYLADSKSTEAKMKADLLARASEDTKKLENQVKEIKDAKEKIAAEGDVLHAMKLKLQEEVDHQMYTTNQLLTENQKLAQEFKLTDDEVAHLQVEMKTLSRMRETLQRKLKQMEESKRLTEQERDSLKSLVYSLERQVDSHKKQAETDHKQIDDLIRERDILSKNYLKATSATQKQANLVKLHEQTKQNLEQEIIGFKEEAAKQRKLILALEKERDRYVNEAAQIQQGKLAAEEEAIIKENQIFDYKKKIAEAEYKLKQQQALYEQVRSDRNLYSKNLIESQDEITEMRRKLKIMSHQIEQYKEEISAKESALLKEHFEHLKVEKEKEGAKQELQKLKQQLDAAHQFIQNQQAEENKLRHIITDADSERLHQKKEYEAVIQERVCTSK